MLDANDPAFQRQFPNGAIVRDRLGWLVRGVVACDPMTGEVISVVTVNGRMLSRHAFHPAPLTIEARPWLHIGFVNH